MKLKAIVDVSDARSANTAGANFAPESFSTITNLSVTTTNPDVMTVTADYSADPYAGTTAPNGKAIWTPDQAGDNLNRTGTNFLDYNYGVLDDGVLTFGFFTYEQFMSSYFFERVSPSGSPLNADAFYAKTYGMFEAFREDQKVAAANAIGMWDDLINVSFKLAEPGTDADIMFGAAYMGNGVGAHAYYPQAEALDEFYGTTNYGKTSGDVMINWLYNSPTGGTGGNNIGFNRPADDSFSNFDYGSYGNEAIMHELGHSLGLSHTGDYNASDGLGPITYANRGKYFQDSMQYSLMSYFQGYETGQSSVNLETITFLYAQTPMVHDIYIAQRIYGADMTTRTGNTVYGFNSTADKGVYDFTQNTQPMLSIWDAGGNDTLDLSGFNSNSIIDINEGAFSSASNKVTDAVKAADMAYFGMTTEAQWQAFLAKYAMNPDGSLHDNISIAYGAKIENAIGGVGNDTITGNALANFLSGGAGNDKIRGGNGYDVIKLGTGNDIFVAEQGTKTSTKAGSLSLDIVTDFTTGQDKIDVSALGSMNFRGSSANKNVGDLTYKVYDSVNGAEKALGFNIHSQYGVDNLSGPVTVVFADTDHKAGADMAIVLLNHNGVTASDFMMAA